MAIQNMTDAEFSQLLTESFAKALRNTNDIAALMPNYGIRSGGNGAHSSGNGITGGNTNNFIGIDHTDIKALVDCITSLKDVEEAKKILDNRDGINGGSAQDFEQARRYIGNLEKLYNAQEKIEKEKQQYEVEYLEIQAANIEAQKENNGYLVEQGKHTANLAEIEAKARKEHLKEIKSVFEEEEKIRRDGLAKYEVAEKARKDHVKNIASNVVNKKGQYSAGKELWNKFILAPLTDKFGKSFGKYATDSKGTVLARGAAGLFGGAAKFGNTIASGKMDVSGMASSLSSKLMSTGNPWAMVGGAALNILKTAFEMYSKVDKAASDYARKVGGGAVAQEKMRKSAANLAVEMGKFGERTYNAEKILENMAATSEVFGRNLEYLSTQDLKAITDLKDFGISNETISQFDTLGISVERVSKEFASLYGSAGKKGLNATAVIKSLSSNMKMAQNYTFERGRKALFDMAEKSAQLKFNLRDAETFANKVSTLEGAMKSAAQLSVLGGGFAMQGNPMTLLYNALNDVEGLQDQMLAMTKDLVYWDREKGQFEMSAFDRQRLKAMSEATGIDYSELTSQAFNQGRVDRISRQIKPGTDKDVAEYIKNIAFIDENGNAKIQFHDGNGREDGEAKLLSEVLNNKELVNRLKGESEAKDVKDNATVGDIMNSTRSIQDKLDDLVNQVKNYLVKGVMRLVERFSSTKKIESMYNFEGDKREQFERVRDKLSNGTLSNKDFKDISEEDRNLYKRMGILDKKDGHYIGRSTDQRYGRSFLGIGGDLYGNSEIAQMFNGAYEPKKFDGGGYTGDGNPNEIAGLVHKGEYVIDADTTKSMFSSIKNGENPLNHKDFAQRVGNLVKTRANDLTDGKQSVKVEFGTLRLELGGATKDVDMNAFANVLLSNNSFIEILIQKMATTKDFGYRKDDAQFKYVSQL